MVFANPVTHKYAPWDHEILRETSFPVGPCLLVSGHWPILTSRVLTLQDKVSVGLWGHSCVTDSYNLHGKTVIYVINLSVTRTITCTCQVHVMVHVTDKLMM